MTLTASVPRQWETDSDRDRVETMFQEEGLRERPDPGLPGSVEMVFPDGWQARGEAQKEPRAGITRIYDPSGVLRIVAIECIEIGKDADGVDRVVKREGTRRVAG